MKEKIYMFNENIFIINAIVQGILATSKTKLWTMSVLELRLWFAVMRTTEETHVCNFAKSWLVFKANNFQIWQYSNLKALFSAAPMDFP